MHGPDSGNNIFLAQGRYRAVIIDENSPGYFGVVGTYIHLNPARAGLIRVGEEPLKRYRWSSYPWYLNRAGRRLPKRLGFSADLF